MPLREQRDQQLFEHVALTDDDLGTLGEDALSPLAEPVGRSQIIGLESGR